MHADAAFIDAERPRPHHPVTDARDAIDGARIADHHVTVAIECYFGITIEDHQRLSGRVWLENAKAAVPEDDAAEDCGGMDDGG